MITAITLVAAQGLGLLDAMAKDMATTNRLSGSIVVRRPGQEAQTAHFFLAKPNRFELKGAGNNIKFDGAKRWTIKNGKWVAISRDGSLPVLLKGFEPFFGRKLAGKSVASGTTGIPGQGFKVADNQVLYINRATKRPVGRSIVDPKGQTTWVYFKNVRKDIVKSLPGVVTGGSSAITLKTPAPPVTPATPKSTGTFAVSVPLPMANSVTTLVPIEMEVRERPAPPIPISAEMKAGSNPGLIANMGTTQALPIMDAAASMAAKLPKVGTEFATFTAPTPDGQTVDLAKILQKSQGVVLVFWHTNCPATGQFLPYLEKRRAELREAKIFLLGVDCGDSAVDIKQFLAGRKFGLTTAMTPSGGVDLRDQAGIVAYPTTIILDSKGIVIASFVGDDEAAFDAALAALKPK